MGVTKKKRAPIFRLEPISAVGLDFSKILSICSLRAMLSRVSGAKLFALCNPRVWSATAYTEIFQEGRCKPKLCPRFLITRM